MRYPAVMSKQERPRNDEEISEGVLDADDTGLVRNEAEIVEEEIEEGLSPEELPVNVRGEEGRTDRR